jgi:hypothetical protein
MTTEPPSARRTTKSTGSTPPSVESIASVSSLNGASSRKKATRSVLARTNGIPAAATTVTRLNAATTAIGRVVANRADASSMRSVSPCSPSADGGGFGRYVSSTGNTVMPTAKAVTTPNAANKPNWRTAGTTLTVNDRNPCAVVTAQSAVGTITASTARFTRVARAPNVSAPPSS